jgi:perosamine synthetase
MSTKKEKTKQGFVWPKIDKEMEKIVLKQLNESISIYDGGGIFYDFEKKFAKYHKRKFAVLCNSGTNAIHSMFVAAELKEGDEVICPAYTFFATVTPLLFTGAKPILCDCDDNYNIDPIEIEKKITKRTKAVLVTHMWGVPAQMDKIVAICKRKKLLLMEDCSHAHGASYKNKVVGSFGDLSAWSLQGGKNITGGEGGILTTNNQDYYERALLLGHYNKRCSKDISLRSKWREYVTTGMGLKYRAHPLAIAIASKIFTDFEKNNFFRNKYAREIIANLKNSKNIILPPAYFDKKFKPSWYALTFLLKDDYLKDIKIESFLRYFSDKGLTDIDNPGSTKPLNLLPLFQKPSVLFPIYKNKNNSFSYKRGDFPKAEKIFNSLIKIPVGVDKSDKKIVDIYNQELGLKLL